MVGVTEQAKCVAVITVEALGDVEGTNTVCSLKAIKFPLALKARDPFSPWEDVDGVDRVPARWPADCIKFELTEECAVEKLNRS